MHELSKFGTHSLYQQNLWFSAIYSFAYQVSLKIDISTLPLVMNTILSATHIFFTNSPYPRPGDWSASNHRWVLMFVFVHFSAQWWIQKFRKGGSTLGCTKPQRTRRFLCYHTHFCHVNAHVITVLSLLSWKSNISKHLQAQSNVWKSVRN